MTNLEVLGRSVRYDRWATETLLESVRTLEAPSSEIIRILGHMVGAQQLWLARLHGDQSPLAVWPSLTLQEIEKNFDACNAALQLFMDNQRAEKLLRPIAYTNSKGVPWANRVEEILHHMLLHAAHHRGQIALLLRSEGIDPPLMDFIHAVRTGGIE